MLDLILRDKNFFDGFLTDVWSDRIFNNYNMPVEITENEKEYILKADLPGLEEKDIKVEFDRGSLTISGERKNEKKEKNEKCYRSEIVYGKFSKTFDFGDDVKEDEIKASFKNGVLEVILPKQESKKARLIPLN